MSARRLILVSLIIGLIIGAGVVYFWANSKWDDLENKLLEARNTSAPPDQGLMNTIAKQNEQIRELQIIAGGLEENKDWMQGDRGMAYIRNVLQKDSKTSVIIDPILWLSQTDGSCTTSDEFAIRIPKCNPNGFLEINKSSATTSFSLSAATVFSVLTNDDTGNIAGKDISFADFLVMPRRKDENPYWFEMESGKVVRVVEQYRP